jgi:hypothetical protein
MNEAGRVQGVTGAFTAEVQVCDPSEFIVNERKKALVRRVVSISILDEKLGDISGILVRHRNPDASAKFLASYIKRRPLQSDGKVRL